MDQLLGPWVESSVLENQEEGTVCRLISVNLTRAKSHPERGKHFHYGENALGF